MSGSIFRSTRARLLALAAGAAVLVPLATAAPSYALVPTAGTNCVNTDGKISGRGSTLQLWLQYQYIGSYASNVCGPVGVDPNANGQGSGNAPPLSGPQFDITHPGAALSTLTGGTTYTQDWMISYNYTDAQRLGSSGNNSAIGSGSGETAQGCRAEAFAGTDIPVTATQLSNINGTVPVLGGTGTSNGKNCDPNNGTANALVSPFSPPAPFPNLGDAGTQATMVVPIGVSAIDVFANLPTGCSSSTGTVPLTQADVAGLFGGSFQNWGQVSAFSSNTTCTATPVDRVVRNDNSGTTQGMDNYLAASNGYHGTTTAGDTCDTDNTNLAISWQQLQNNQANAAPGGSNVHWPGGVPAAGTTKAATGTCSAITNPASPGGPFLISTAEGINGALGYADLADTQHDTNNFQSQVAGNNIIVFSLPNSVSGNSDPGTSGRTGGSNCNMSGANLPTGGAPAAVGLGGKWNLTAQTLAQGGPSDVSFAAQGSTYPACVLTWDFVWSRENGNTPPATITETPAITLPYGPAVTAISSVAGLPQSGSFSVAATNVTTNTTASGTLPITTLTVAADGGIPSSGTFTLVDSSGTETLNYTGVSGNTLTGVSGGTAAATFVNGAVVTFPTANAPCTYTALTAAPQVTATCGGYTGSAAGPGNETLIVPKGTGGPNANLTADQRRTLYSYFVYLMSPLAQGQTTVAGYAQLPAAWLGPILQGFQGSTGY
jgi:hypothetical protein